MNPKIMKLRTELEKNKGKISDLQGRNRELKILQEKMFLIQMLQNRQTDIDANNAIHMRHVKAYRAAVISLYKNL